MTTVELWTFREDVLTGDIDMTGWSVEATDGDIGKVDEATYETGASFLVIDTGPWIFGKKVILPAGVIQRIEPEDERIFVSRTKDEIKDAPELGDVETSDYESHRADLDRYWGERAVTR